MSSFLLKIIACICMFCDHFGYYYYGTASFLNYIGRFAFTIFVFQIVQGYLHTHNLEKYITRLFIFAIISQIPFMLFNYSVGHSLLSINVIFTLLFGLCTITIYDKYNKFVGITCCFSLGILAQVLNFDYGFYGVFIVFIFYLLRNNKFYMALAFIPSVIVYFFSRTIPYSQPISYIFSGNTYSILMFFTCLSIIPILLYNGKKGKDAKYLFYIFYPLHFLILSLLCAL